MNSCLYECSVMHHRLEPKEHHFNYRIFMFALDLDEVPALAKRLPFFSLNRWNLYTFRDRDHLTLACGETKSAKETSSPTSRRTASDSPPTVVSCW